MSSFLGGGGGGGTGVGSIPATGNVTVWVATTGSDSNPGTLAQPFATVQHAVAYILLFDYQNLYSGVINVEAGSYSYGGSASLNLNKVTRPLNPTSIVGAGESTTIIEDLNGNNGFLCLGGAFWIITGIRIKTDAFAFGAIGGSAEIQIFDCGMDEHNVGTGGPAAAIFCNNAGIAFMLNTFDVAVNEIDSLVQIFDASFCFIFASTLTLQTTTKIHNNKAFIIATDQSDVYYTPGTVVNGGGVGVSGHQLISQAGCVITTNNGLLTDIPGINGAVSDGSCALINNSTGAGSFFGNSKSGPPTTSQVSPGFYGTWKDTGLGGRFSAYNDAGVLYTSQIGHNINTQTGASYTLALGDQEGIVEMNNAGANTLTVPPNSSVNFTVGTKIQIVQVGVGTTTIMAGVGVTGRNFGMLAAQWDQVTLYQRATNEWVMTL